MTKVNVHDLDLEDDALRMRRVREMQRRVRESRDAEADLRTRLEEAKKRRRLAELKLDALLDAEIQPCPLFDRRPDPEPEVPAEEPRATPAVARRDVTSDVTPEPARPGFRLDELDLEHVLADAETVAALARWGAKTVGDLVDRVASRAAPLEKLLRKEAVLSVPQIRQLEKEVLDWLDENPPPAPEDAPRCRTCKCVEAEAAGCILLTGSACTWAEPDRCSACVTPKSEKQGKKRKAAKSEPEPASPPLTEQEDESPTQGERSHVEWVRTVRDPADAAAGPVVRHEHGKSLLEYQLAPLPGGRWATHWRFQAGVSGQSAPWRAYPDLVGAQDALARAASAFFSENAPKKPDAAWRKIMALVEGLAEGLATCPARPDKEPENPAPCAKCKAVAGEPCKNYKGQRKQTCPDRGKPAEQTSSAQQSDLFGAQAAAAPERPSLVDGRARVPVGIPSDVVNLLWDEPAGLYEATVASGFHDWLDPDVEAPRPTEGRVAAAVAEVVGRPVECAGVSFSCRGVPTFGFRPLSRPATVVEAPKPAAPEPTEPFQLAGEAPPSRADLRNAYLPGAIGGRARDKYASVRPVELGLRFWVVWGITSDATNDTYGLLPLLTTREFALAYPGVVAVMEPRADRDPADLYRGLMVAVGRKHYVVGSQADGRSVTLPRKEA